MTEQFGGAVGNWRCRGTLDKTAEDDWGVILKCTSAIQAINGYWYAGLNVHAGACVNGQWANADRTGQALSANQTLVLAERTLTIQKQRTAQKVTCIADVRVSGYAGGYSRTEFTYTVPAKAKHTVSYNANGGTGAPASQTKWYGENLYVSTTKPARGGYQFLYWTTAANGSGTRYQPGQRYLPDANTTLYAQWKRLSVQPWIGQFVARRVNAAGVADETGTSVRVKATWGVDTKADTSNTVQKLVVGVQDAAGVWTDHPITVSGTKGEAETTIDNLSADATWRFRATITDKHGSYTTYATVGPQRFLLDFSPDGRGIGVGVAAPETGVSIAGTPVLINGLDLVPKRYASNQFLTYKSGFGDYKGAQHNISRCYAIRSGYLLILQVECTGTFKTGYTEIGVLKPDFIPGTAINVSAVYNTGGVGSAFVVGPVADESYQPGHIYFGNPSTVTYTWAAATFVCVTDH